MRQEIKRRRDLGHDGGEEGGTKRRIADEKRGSSYCLQVIEWDAGGKQHHVEIECPWTKKEKEEKGEHEGGTLAKMRLKRRDNGIRRVTAFTTRNRAAVLQAIFTSTRFFPREVCITAYTHD